LKGVRAAMAGLLKRSNRSWGITYVTLVIIKSQGMCSKQLGFKPQHVQHEAGPTLRVHVYC
jgi:hypothetical protein